MKPIKVLVGTTSLLTLMSVGYYGCLKSVERMYGISIGLIAGGILAQTTTNRTAAQSSIFTSARASNPKRRRKVLRSLRTRAKFSQQWPATPSHPTSNSKVVAATSGSTRSNKN